MALHHLLLIQPKLLLVGAIVLLIAVVFTFVLDGGTASADCFVINTTSGEDTICDQPFLDRSILHDIAYAWNYWF